MSSLKRIIGGVRYDGFAASYAEVASLYGGTLINPGEGNPVVFSNLPILNIGDWLIKDAGVLLVKTDADKQACYSPDEA